MKFYLLIVNGTPSVLVDDRNLVTKMAALGLAAGEDISVGVVPSVMTAACDGEAVDDIWDSAMNEEPEIYQDTLAQVREQMDLLDPLELKVVH